MRRASVLVPVFVLLLGALVIGVGSRVLPTAAQEETPTSEEELEGVSFEPLGFGTTEELPAAPAELLLARVTLDPGAGFPIEEDDPSVGLLYVESGSLTIRVEAPVTVIRAATIAAFATPGAAEGEVTPPEEVAAWTEYTLNERDSVVIPANVAGEVRNDGTEPAVAMGALIIPAETDETGEADATPST